jgi:hypothetical protein
MVSIRATYIDPQYPKNPTIRVMVIYVKPGRPHHVSIELSATPPPSRDGNTDTLQMDSSETQLLVFGAVRDRYGNLVRMVSHPTWQFANGCPVLQTIATSQQPDRAIIRRTSHNPGTCYLHLSQDTLLSDSSVVIADFSGLSGFKAFAVENPFKPGVSQVPQSIRTLINQNLIYGTTIVIQAYEGVSQGRLSIYDPFGNAIVKSGPMVLEPLTNRLYYIWDGRNLNGRYVGIGAYLAVVTATLSESNASVTRRFKLGVQ